MRDRLERANQLLEFITHALDELTEILEASEAELPRGRELVEEASELLLNVQQSVYAYDPTVAPVWKGDPQWREQMLEYGKLLVTTRELWAQGRYEETLPLWRDYLATDRQFFYELLAKRMLLHLEKSVREVTAPPSSA